MGLWACHLYRKEQQDHDEFGFFLNQDVANLSKSQSNLDLHIAPPSHSQHGYRHPLRLLQKKQPNSSPLYNLACLRNPSRFNFDIFHVLGPDQHYDPYILSSLDRNR